MISFHFFKKYTLLCTSLVLLYSFQANSKTIDEIIVIVADQVILQSDLDTFKDNLKGQKLVDFEYASLFANANLENDEKAQLDYLVSEKLFIHNAKKLGLYDSVADNLDKEIGKIASSNQLTLNELKKEIQKEGVNFEDYKTFTLNSLVRKRVIEQVIASKIDISEADIIQHMQRTGSKTFIPKFEYKLSHILVSRSADIEMVESTIKKTGFYSALKFSESDSDRGELGTFKEGEMTPTIEKIVKTLKVNEISPPIYVGDNVFFIKLDDKVRINSLPNTPEVRKIRAELIQNSLSREIEKWLEDQKETNHIKFFKS